MSPGPGAKPLQPQQGGKSNGESEHVVMIDKLLKVDGSPVDLKLFFLLSGVSDCAWSPPAGRG